ncbi:UNVERIFIED_ORG: hypothetical protein ABIC43_004695 [Variovorax guangxiensis]
MLSQLSFPLFAQVAQRQPECPPAGASQEVNEAAPSLAAPSASGQQAGTPRPPNSVLWRYRTSRHVLGQFLDGGRVHPSVVRQCASNLIWGYAL